MAQAGINIQLSIKEIYDACCEECKRKIKELVKDKIADSVLPL